MKELFDSFLIAVTLAIALWISVRFYVNMFRNLWALSRWSVGRVRWYIAWFSFLHRRRKIERFKELADRLWWRDQVRQAADRNILPPR